jgi:hypothetical protein
MQNQMGAVVLTVQKSNTEAMAFYNKLRYSGKIEILGQRLIIFSTPNGCTFWLLVDFVVSTSVLLQHLNLIVLYRRYVISSTSPSRVDLLVLLYPETSLDKNKIFVC